MAFQVYLDYPVILVHLALVEHQDLVVPLALQDNLDSRVKKVNRDLVD